MTNIFKKYFSTTKYFPDLRPNERIRKVLETYVKPEMEKFGYILDDKKLSFKKEINGFTAEIEFLQYKNNTTGQIVSFIPNIFIHSTAYNKWLVDNNRTKEVGHFYYIQADNIKNWSHKYCKNGWFDLEENDNEEVVKNLNDNFINTAFPYIDKFLNFESILNTLMSMHYYGWAPLLFDFCIIIQNKNTATEVINWFNARDLDSINKTHTDTINDIKQREITLQNWV